MRFWMMMRTSTNEPGPRLEPVVTITKVNRDIAVKTQSPPAVGLEYFSWKNSN